MPDEVVRGKAITVGLQTGGLRLHVGKVVVGVVAAEQPVLDRERVRPGCELREVNIAARPVADLRTQRYPRHGEAMMSRMHASVGDHARMMLTAVFGTRETGPATSFQGSECPAQITGECQAAVAWMHTWRSIKR